MPNRTGVRETERSLGQTSAQARRGDCISVTLLCFQVREDQESLLAQQDAGLDMLHEIVTRQKGMGQQIFREVTVQNELIDDIGDRTENVNARLLATTG